MAQGGVIRQLLASLTSIELNRLHQTIDVAFQHDAIIDDGRYFIDQLGQRNWYSRSWRYREAAFSSSSYFFHFD